MKITTEASMLYTVLISFALSSIGASGAAESISQGSALNFSHKAGSVPNWGFANPNASLANSLYFDQAFDSKKLRPQPFILSSPDSNLCEVKASKSSVAKRSSPLISRSPYVASPLRGIASVSSETLASVTAPNVSSLPKVQMPAVSEMKATIGQPVPNTLVTLAPHAAAPAPTPPEPTKAIFHMPRAKAEIARVVILKEESLYDASPEAIADAKIHWVSPESKKLLSVSDSNGSADAPIVSADSVRFFVTAPGYLPAMGYAAAGQVTPVVLYSESRLAPILQSLGTTQDSDRTMVLGKVLDRHLRPVENIVVDPKVEKPFGVSYSIGSFGVFHPKAESTGPQGDFFISGLERGLQYLMPSRILGAPKASGDAPTKEWPAAIMDFSDTSSIVTVTLQEALPTRVNTQIVDLAEEEREANQDSPEKIPMTISVGGQNPGDEFPDSEGFITFKSLYLRNTADLVVIDAPGYKRTWVNGVANPQSFPTVIGLFSSSSLEDVFHEVLQDVDFSKGVILGHLRPERFQRPVVIQVYASNGHLNHDAHVYYVNPQNLVKANQDKTHAVTQNFAVTGLSAGEWHLIAYDAKSVKNGNPRRVGITTVRTEEGTLSQVQF